MPPYEAQRRGKFENIHLFFQTAELPETPNAPVSMRIMNLVSDWAGTARHDRITAESR